MRNVLQKQGVCVCVCVRACVRVRARVCVCVCVWSVHLRKTWKMSSLIEIVLNVGFC
jgi:hypothetical protein